MDDQEMTTIDKGILDGENEVAVRHPLNWKDPLFWDESVLFQELERVYDICHGCRRCLGLCHVFPTLFELVDESDTMEVDGVARQDYWKVVDHCRLCDLCYMAKCPYISPHHLNLDFPLLMLRAKAVAFKKRGVGFRDKLLASRDKIGSLASIPVVVQIVNAAGKSRTIRSVLEKMVQLHPDTVIPEYHRNSLRKRLQNRIVVEPFQSTDPKVILFTTCHGNYNEPDLGEDLVAIFEHNDISVALAEKERCCGIPWLEMGDLASVEKAKNVNIPVLAEWVDRGWDIVSIMPSCVLMFKHKLPLIFPDDPLVQKVKNVIFDPFEYLMLRHKEGRLKTGFKHSLGVVSYHHSCHLRAQDIGMETRDILNLVPGTHVEIIVCCSRDGNGSIVKSEYHDISVNIACRLVDRIKQTIPDHYSSDCSIAGHQIENGLANGSKAEHPLILLRKAYGI